MDLGICGVLEQMPCRYRGRAVGCKRKRTESKTIGLPGFNSKLGYGAGRWEYIFFRRFQICSSKLCLLKSPRSNDNSINNKHFLVLCGFLLAYSLKRIKSPWRLQFQVWGRKYHIWNYTLCGWLNPWLPRADYGTRASVDFGICGRSWNRLPRGYCGTTVHTMILEHLVPASKEAIRD